jgi:hypothetical protein
MEKEMIKEIVQEIDKIICFNSRYEMKVSLDQRIDKIDENIKKLNKKINFIKFIIIFDIVIVLISLILK